MYKLVTKKEIETEVDFNITIELNSLVIVKTPRYSDEDGAFWYKTYINDTEITARSISELLFDIMEVQEKNKLKALKYFNL